MVLLQGPIKEDSRTTSTSGKHDGLHVTEVRGRFWGADGNMPVIVRGCEENNCNQDAELIILFYDVTQS